MAKRQTYGNGSMTERGPGIWRLRVMSNGKQVQETFRGTEAAARRALGKLAQKPPTPKRDQRTVADLMERYVAHIEARGRSPRTVDEARRAIDKRIAPRFGHLPVTELTGERIDAAYTVWLAEGLASATVHRLGSVLSSALTLAFRWGWIDYSPAARATAPTAKSARKLVIPTPAEVADLIHAAEGVDPVLAAAIVLSFVTGARRGELCALRWSDVDLDAGTVRIERSMSQSRSGVAEKSTKTGRGRTVAIDDRALAILRRHQAWQVDLSHQAESPLVADPYVLSGNANAGRPMTPSKITDRFIELRDRVGVQGVRFHDLRHANATEQIAAGIPVPVVSARLGHANASMTLDRYAHALPAGDVAAAAVMGALLPG